MIVPSAALYKFVFLTVVVTIMASAQSAYSKNIGTLRYSNLRNNDAIKTRRGGCAAFGHSCFGGHGKRMDTAAEKNEAELNVGNQFPTNFKAVFTNDELSIPGEIFKRYHPENNESNVNVPLPNRFYDNKNYSKLTEFFKKWLANNYRRKELFVVRK